MGNAESLFAPAAGARPVTPLHDPAPLTLARMRARYTELADMPLMPDDIVEDHLGMLGRSIADAVRARLVWRCVQLGSAPTEGMQINVVIAGNGLRAADVDIGIELKGTTLVDVVNGAFDRVGDHVRAVGAKVIDAAELGAVAERLAAGQPAPVDIDIAQFYCEYRYPDVLRANPQLLGRILRYVLERDADSCVVLGLIIGAATEHEGAAEAAPATAEGAGVRRRGLRSE